MSRYPLLFTFRDPIAGRSFLAGVQVAGRALMVKEGENDFWMYGIQPGAIAASGKTFDEAYGSFRESHRLALYDLAHEARNFRSFENEVVNYFNSIPVSTSNDWDAAVQEVKAGRIEYEGIPKQNAASPRKVTVRLLELNPGLNESELAPALVHAETLNNRRLAA